MNVNKIIITGNLTADPELRYTTSGKAVLSASIANNEHFTDAQGQEQKVTTFINLEVWGRPAENFGRLVKKGQELFLDGKLRMDEWTDKQTNARRTRLYLLIENWQFTQFKRQEESTSDAPPLLWHLVAKGIRVELNVAGPRESKEPGVYDWTLAILRLSLNRAAYGAGSTETAGK